MSLEVRQRGASVTPPQRSCASVAAKTDGESAPPLQTAQATQTTAQPAKSLGELTLREVWNGIVNFFKNGVQAIGSFFGKLFAAPLDPERAAIANAYHLQPTKQNVDAFLAEAQSYEENGSIGPGSPVDAVKSVQENLKQLGYDVPTNGDFDPATCAAVIDFKQKNGIQQNYKLEDGTAAVNEFVTPGTLLLLQQKAADSSQPTTSTSPTQTTPPILDPALTGNEAIIKQYNLLPTKENVDTFLAETKAYETNGTLGPGMDAPAEIREMQTILSSLGYAVTVNSTYDEATSAAVVKFKQDTGIHEGYKLADGSDAVNQYATLETLEKLLERAEAASTPAQPVEPEGSGPLLAQGASGDAVSKLQTRLKEIGFDPGAVDGIMGPNTVAAVKNFQTSKGLDADGIVGPLTWKQLGITVGNSVAATPPSGEGSGPVISMGASGDPVSKLQTRLLELGFDPGGIDGITGPNTIAAVKNFQASRGLDADGVVGPLTWQQLGITVEGTVEYPASSQSSSSLAALDNAAFFAALRPAAEEAERQYGVPACVTLAQAALESGWGEYTIGEYNVFGIKGSGPAGTIAMPTQEWDGSGYITITDNFALYNNLNEAVAEHGKLFHNGYYDVAINQFAQDHNYVNFVNNIQGIYATDPEYSAKIFSIIDEYGLA